MRSKARSKLGMLSDEEFIQRFREIGRLALAKECQVSTRSIDSRRERIEGMTGEPLYPGGAGGAGRLEHGAPPVVEGACFSRQDPPPAHRSVEELVEYRRQQYRQKDAHEQGRKRIRIDIKMDGPIGILWEGDPHVDDDGADIDALEEHALLARDTEGVFACCVGDVTNNWVGRLARLYAEQSTTAAEAWLLAEWWLNLHGDSMLWLVGGNHEAFSGASDPIRWIMRAKAAAYEGDEVRAALHLPGDRVVRIHNRHAFPGHSMYNPAHGVGRELQFGKRDHIAVAGHIHTSGYMVLRDPSDASIVMHAVQVASYKRHDLYSRQKGFKDNRLGPSALTVINPVLSDHHPDFIKLFWEPREGVDYLSFLRSRG